MYVVDVCIFFGHDEYEWFVGMKLYFFDVTLCFGEWTTTTSLAQTMHEHLFILLVC